MIAATRDHASVALVRALLKAGANPALTSERGRTAAALASDFLHGDIARELAVVPIGL